MLKRRDLDLDMIFWKGVTRDLETGLVNVSLLTTTLQNNPSVTAASSPTFLSTDTLMQIHLLYISLVHLLHSLWCVCRTWINLMSFVIL